MIFSVLKRRWSDVCDAYERNCGHHVNKSNFLGLYAKAHMQTLTKDNIMSAFKATGIVPFNPDVITATKMAPSLETSSQSGLPVYLSSPVQAVSAMLMDYRTHPPTAESSQSSLPALSTHLSSPTRSAIDSLAQSSGSFLLSSSPITSAIPPPLYSTQIISPVKRRYTKLLDLEPGTEHEQALQDALRASEDTVNNQKTWMRGMQATTVIQNSYVGQTHTRLQEHEERKKQPRKRSRLNGDGRPKLVTGDEFTDRVRTHEEEADQEEAAKEARGEAVKKYKVAVEEWKKLEESCVAINERKRTRYQDHVT